MLIQDQINNRELPNPLLFQQSSSSSSLSSIPKEVAARESQTWRSVTIAKNFCLKGQSSVPNVVLKELKGQLVKKTQSKDPKAQLAKKTKNKDPHHHLTKKTGYALDVFDGTLPKLNSALGVGRANMCSFLLTKYFLALATLPRRCPSSYLGKNSHGWFALLSFFSS